MEKTKDPIGDNLLKTRKERKVSVPALSEMLGIPKDRIYKWEQGASTPQYEDRVKIEEWIKNGNWKNFPRSTISDKGENQTDSQLNAPLPLGDLKVTLKDHLDLLKEMTARAEREKDRLYNIMEKGLSEILTNSKTTLEALARIQNITVADDAVNMAYLDKAQGLAKGTSAAIAGTAERAMNNLTEEDDKTSEDHKPGKTSKAKKQQP